MIMKFFKEWFNRHGPVKGTLLMAGEAFLMYVASRIVCKPIEKKMDEKMFGDYSKNYLDYL